MKYLFVSQLSIAFLLFFYSQYIKSRFEVKSTVDVPTIVLSDFFEVNEEKVKYSSHFFDDGENVGFDAILDSSFFVKLVKLGKTSSKDINSLVSVKNSPPNSKFSLNKILNSSYKNVFYEYHVINLQNENIESIKVFHDGLKIREENYCKFFICYELVYSGIGISINNMDIDFSLISNERKCKLYLCISNGEVFVLYFHELPSKFENDFNIEPKCIPL